MRIKTSLLILILTVSVTSCQTSAMEWKQVFPNDGTFYLFANFSSESIYAASLYDESIYRFDQNSQKSLFSDNLKQIDLPDELVLWQLCIGDSVWVIGAGAKYPGAQVLRYDSQKEIWQNKTSDFGEVNFCKKLYDGRILFLTPTENHGNAFIIDHETVQKFSASSTGEIGYISPRSSGGFWILSRDGTLFSLMGDDLTKYGHTQENASLIETQPGHLWIANKHQIEEWLINDTDASSKPGVSFENKDSKYSPVGLYLLDESLLVVWSDSIWIITPDNQRQVMNLPSGIGRTIVASDFDSSSRTLLILTSVGVYEKVFP